MKYQFNDEKHLHTLNGKPLTGTSSVVGVLSKPLSYWASGKACGVLGWLNSKKATNEEREKSAHIVLDELKKMEVVDYIKLLDTAYHAHAKNLKDTAKAGTDLHAELEAFVKSEMGKIPAREFDPKIKPFIDWAKENVKEYVWSEAHCYSEKLWLGGISDVGVILKDDTLAIIDFKSSKEAYPSHFLQDAGYAIQIEENGLWDCGGKVNKKLDKKVEKLIVVPFGAEVVVPSIRTEVEEYKKGFESALVLYRLLGMEKK